MRTNLASQSDPSPLRIETGYQPNVIARCVEMHALYYARTSGFGLPFESKVAGGLAEFFGRIDHPNNQFWRALSEDRVVGTIAIDGEDLGSGLAHLRWFITDDCIRGYGMGRQLLKNAVQFCDFQKFKEIHLWTFKGLDAARHLYESFGFELVEEFLGTQWGKKVMEQRFVRKTAK